MKPAGIPALVIGSLRFTIVGLCHGESCREAGAEAAAEGRVSGRVAGTVKDSQGHSPSWPIKGWAGGPGSA